MPQDQLDGMPEDTLKLRLSFAGMQAAALYGEPELRDPIFLAISGHVSKVAEPNGDDESYVIVTVKGDAKVITQAQYAKLIAS